ncbi:hypothetical protein B0H13DRAFT_1600421 [Mycena leptocephala]|nr:hypothetical protein B0H13DRAFT_1600421 [Mycena leptocephala]
MTEDGVPHWAAGARAALEEGGGGEVWDRVVDMWWKNEQAVGFAGPGKGQAAKMRPAQVAAWIARAREGGPRPALVDVFDFASKWWRWWSALNPKWRRTGATPGERLVKSGEGEWGGTVQTGPNGLLNVLICLRWWKDAIKDDELGAWEEALSDVEWVLGCSV